MQKQEQLPTERNLEVVKEVYRLFAAGRRDDLTGLVSDDFEWHYVGPAEIPWAGRYRGPAGVSAFFERVGAALELEEFEVQEFIAAGDRVVAVGVSSGRLRATRGRYRSPWVNVFTVREGRITRLLDLYDTAAITRAAQPPSGAPTPASKNVTP